MQRAATTPWTTTHTATAYTAATRAWATIRLLVSARLQAWTRDRWLGFWWWLVEPLSLTVGYYVVVKSLRGTPSQSLLFLASALLPWSWFTASTSLAQQSLVRNAAVLKALATNYAYFPAAEFLAATVRFLPALVVWAILLVFEPAPISSTLFYLPLVLAVQAAFSLALSFHLALVQVRVPDAAQFWNVAIRFWFLLSPGLYEVNQAPAALHEWLKWNPFTPLFEAYRAILMRGEAPPLVPLASLTLASVVIAAVGYWRLVRAKGRLPLWL